MKTTDAVIIVGSGDFDGILWIFSGHQNLTVALLKNLNEGYAKGFWRF